MPSKTVLPTREEALPGRSEKMVVAESFKKFEPRKESTHAVNGNPTLEPFPSRLEMALFGMGCFWGVEKKFWQEPGVFSTQVGYSGGYSPNPTYEEVCTGLTGHVEVVRVIYDPKETSYEALLKVFWESHDPTQGMKQGKDMGTQYRSAIFTYGPQQKASAQKSKVIFQEELNKKKFEKITTEIREALEFHYAEDYHQQYLFKNPDGYCSLKGTGVTCSLPL